MRDFAHLELYRDRRPEIAAFLTTITAGRAAWFWIPSPTDGARLRVVASAGEGWDHVSVSRDRRCPNWPEMDHVKRLLFHDDETAMQLHVPPKDHVSYHPFCLHLWRPHELAIPRPPAWMVGPTSEAAA